MCICLLWWVSLFFIYHHFKYKSKTSCITDPAILKFRTWDLLCAFKCVALFTIQTSHHVMLLLNWLDFKEKRTWHFKTAPGTNKDIVSIYLLWCPQFWKNESKHLSSTSITFSLLWNVNTFRFLTFQQFASITRFCQEPTEFFT